MQNLSYLAGYVYASVAEVWLKAAGLFPLPEKQPSARNGQSLASQKDFLAKVVWKGGAPDLALHPVPLNPDILSSTFSPAGAKCNILSND